jgi:hypothetical protein
MIVHDDGSFTFNPQFKAVASTPLLSPTVEQIHNETMLFSASWDFAREHGGPLTQEVLNVFPKDNLPPSDDLNLVIDTRCHMLMRGMLPAIGGWHCDDFPRGKKYSQPDLSQPNPSMRHYTITLSTHQDGASNTLFLTKPLRLRVEDPERVWKSVHMAVEKSDIPSDAFFRSEDRVLYEFNQDTIHKAERCQNPGWRFFMRLSWTFRKPQDKIRRQVQVYLPEVEGW